MVRDQLIKTLNQHRTELMQEYGVKSLALFGSVARGDERDGSDVDLLVEFDDRPVGLFHLMATEQRIRDLLGAAKVDLVLRRAVIEELREPIFREAVDVFSTEEMEVSRPSHDGSD
ncbi:MAG: hypothetical protein A2W31_08650 [Planctomycetes bacterium RBG_16_64_10]|nr:MAG: hypothetical protein A2W31_08650 [Planctomycetes bacterium RBG_16_64_10]